MGWERKTKEERQADAAKAAKERTAAQKRGDTPLANTPEPVAWVTDANSAIADINKKAKERSDYKAASDAKTEAARVERSKQKPSLTSGKLSGLATFASTTGRPATTRES
jgi:hypothetical protein